MEPVFIDIHIHTSENPNKKNETYDLDKLLEKINDYTSNSKALISFSDHNFINKKVYLAAKGKIELLLSSELHIRYEKSRSPYHCHIIFNVQDINEIDIDNINSKLDALYPNKVISRNDDNIPSIEDIVKVFDKYDFLLLPHGGQSHSTFDTAIPKNSQFDTALERSIYYNQFDGFTARSNDGLEKTQEYFERLGINEFVNLVTCTDNYDPSIYPAAKDKEEQKFVPTWMLALPTFSGFRLSLSESSRLIYGSKPSNWTEYIGKVLLKNEFLDIDVELTPGLNVVIGGSSSGKTLLVDSIYNKINNNFGNSNYSQYKVEGIYVDNPSGIKPHYIHQNYIIDLINDKNDKGIAGIEIIRNIFPGDEGLTERIRSGLASFKKNLSNLMDSVKNIEELEQELTHIPSLGRLIVNKDISENIIKKLFPSGDTITAIEYSDVKYHEHLQYLSEISDLLKANPFVNDKSNEINSIKMELQKANNYAKYESIIQKIIIRKKNEIDSLLTAENQEQQTKKSNIDKLLEIITKYIKEYTKFNSTIDLLSQYSLTCKTQEIESMGHKLFIENNFVLSKEKLIEIMNKYLKNDEKIEDIRSISPDKLFESHFKKQVPKVKDYNDFVLKIYSDFEGMNKRTYKIVTKEGNNFENLSPGWKTSILLDLLLGYQGDIAPLIIDQPEDNLATDYINHGLLEAIKNTKFKKQIILVSHNATIPMLGDAQNVIVCQNNGQIIIRSNMLEGFLNNKSIVDFIAEITDGGKASIKKRVKKYNLKQYKR